MTKLSPDAQAELDYITRFERERDDSQGWREIAEQAQRNADYYCGLLDQVGAHLDQVEIRRCDDGTLAEDPHRPKIPEMVRALAARAVDLVLPGDEAEALCAPIQDPFEPGSTIDLPGCRPDQKTQDDSVTIRFDDVFVASHPNGHHSLSRLGIINALLDQAVPGLRMVAHVPDSSGDSSPNNIYGLKLLLVQRQGLR